MIDTTESFIVWGIVTFLTTMLAICCFFWLSKISRFENRKKEIALGMIVCVFAVSSFFFLPVLFSKVNLGEIASNIREISSQKIADSAENGEKLFLPPFIEEFAKIVSALPKILISVILWGLSSLVSFLAIAFIMRILFLIREPKTENENEYKRKKLFEYNEKILINLNKKK